MLLLAMSSLQGRPMRSAFDELAALADGVQLTPGNHPTPAFDAYVAFSGTHARTHHGFAFDRRASRVWDGVSCLVSSDSVHPPELSLSPPYDQNSAAFRRAIESGARVPTLETMYPGYVLGSGDDLEWAMARALPLAVDVSHLFIQITQGVITRATLRRVFDYLRIAEVHVSANDGARDQHAPIDAQTFGLDWARERERAGTPIVLECYLHRMSTDARRRQIALLKE